MPTFMLIEETIQITTKCWTTFFAIEGVLQHKAGESGKKKYTKMKKKTSSCFNKKVYNKNKCYSLVIFPTSTGFFFIRSSAC